MAATTVVLRAPLTPVRRRSRHGLWRAFPRPPFRRCPAR